MLLLSRCARSARSAAITVHVFYFLGKSLQFRRIFVLSAVVIVFFKSVTHQLYKTADFLLQIRIAEMGT